MERRWRARYFPVTIFLLSRLLDKLSVKLNFTYEVHIVADNKYGDQKTDETRKKGKSKQGNG